MYLITIWFKANKNKKELAKLTEKIKGMQDKGPFASFKKLLNCFFIKLANYLPVPYIRSISELLILEEGLSIDKFIEYLKFFYGGDELIKKISYTKI